jgi:hypothetical protein
MAGVELKAENAESACRQLVRVARAVDDRIPHLMWAECEKSDLWSKKYKKILNSMSLWDCIIDILELALEKFLNHEEELDVLQQIYVRCFDYTNARMTEMQRDIDVWKFQLFEIPHAEFSNPLRRISVDYALNIARTGQNENKIQEFLKKYPS